MRKAYRPYIFLAFLSLTALVCNLPASLQPKPTSAIDLAGTMAALQGTQTALAIPTATQPATATATLETVVGAPVLGAGSISGRLAFPSEAIPALRIVAFQVGTGVYYYQVTTPNQNRYRFENLPPGRYHVVSYALDALPNSGSAGGYSMAVLCGLSVDCTDHSLIEVLVEAGKEAANIDPTDWYAPANTFPADPVAPVAQPGSISGRLSYPSEGIPPLRIVAFSLTSGAFYYIDTSEGQQYYKIENLPPDKYHVVAYYKPVGLAGGYTLAVICGLSANCTDNSLIDVTVTSNQETQNVDPTDWYAPAGTFPANPLP